MSYDAAFFETHRDGARESARAVVPVLLDLVPARSVVDVGCGLGVWLAVFRDHGVEDVLGVDAAWVDPARLSIPRDRFAARDLERPLGLGRRFDLAISLEVAEHLPESCARDFVDSVVALAPVVLFSAAIPFQAGEHHVNEQWPDYWASLFAERGYLAIDCLRRRFWADERVDWWYAQNMIVYVERSSLERYPRLRRESEVTDPRPLALVHPRRYLEWVEWWTAKSREL
jgi:SAM-dependent methyltransferase